MYLNVTRQYWQRCRLEKSRIYLIERCEATQIYSEDEEIIIKKKNDWVLCSNLHGENIAPHSATIVTHCQLFHWEWHADISYRFRSHNLPNVNYLRKHAFRNWWIHDRNEYKKKNKVRKIAEHEPPLPTSEGVKSKMWSEKKNTRSRSVSWYILLLVDCHDVPLACVHCACVCHTPLCKSSKYSSNVSWYGNVVDIMCVYGVAADKVGIRMWLGDDAFCAAFAFRRCVYVYCFSFWGSARNLWPCNVADMLGQRTMMMMMMMGGLASPGA